MNVTNELRTSELLKTLGVSPGLLGYSYLRESINLVVDDERIVHKITSALYPTVAKKFETTPSRVERAMRHAIEVAWSRGSLDTIYSIFGHTVSTATYRPTNGEFIATVADYLRITQGE